MSKIRIIGGQPLHGEIIIGGAKNAALPLMAASLLTSKPFTLTNVPHLSDISTMAHLLMQMGVSMQLDGENDAGGFAGRVITLDAKEITEPTAPYDIVKKMRASVLVLGPLLARFGRARISLPGGCAIGTRPIDLHLKAMEAMGATINMAEGYVEAVAENGLTGGEYDFPVVSVGATENAVMAATLAQGTTTFTNCAREPEITDLCQCLVKMGADIQGIGSQKLVIKGVSELGAVTHHIVSDRIEAGTYAIAAMITGGEITLKNIDTSIMQSTFDTLVEIGAQLHQKEQEFTISANPQKLNAIELETQVYPGFATDMQAQVMALLCLAKGTSVIRETIFENRFMHVAELTRMGANIHATDHTATVHGIEAFHGAEVMATDLRASVSLILAALTANEETLVDRIYHLDRGYEFLEDKLSACGANVTRIRN